MRDTPPQQPTALSDHEIYDLYHTFLLQLRTCTGQTHFGTNTLDLTRQFLSGMQQALVYREKETPSSNGSDE